MSMSTTPFFHSELVSSDQIFPIPEEDQLHHTQISSFSTSPYPPFLFDHHKPHEEAVLHDHHEIMKGSSTWCHDYSGGGGIHRSSSSSSSDHGGQERPVKWMSSKMRIMRKMIINSYQTPPTKPRRCSNTHHLLIQDQNKKKQQPNLDSIIRVCSDCNTTKTPLWRSGPSGPKSLCNACGIRQRKARRAMAAANSAVKDNGALEVDRTVPFKKRCRFGAAAAAAAVCVDQRKLCLEEIVIRLSKSSAFHRVFPQDEKDAAILLMALSCGLLCSS